MNKCFSELIRLLHPVSLFEMDKMSTEVLEQELTPTGLKLVVTRTFGTTPASY
jgi:hypothetical protein